MNRFFKIVMLVAAIVLAVGGVMVYYKTKVSPPRKIAFDNPHFLSDQNDLPKVFLAESAYELDTIYVKLTHGLDFQLANSFLSPQERDGLLVSFVHRYVSAYVDYCNAQFENSVWNERDLKAMQKRISELQALRLTDGCAVAQGGTKDSLSEVSRVITNYYGAKKVASSTRFRSLKSAKETIRLAKKYASMDPIRNCKDLVKRLNEVPSRIGRSHYSYLEKRVESLKNYLDYSYDDYQDLVTSISEEIKKYEGCAKSLYGEVFDVAMLRAQAAHYYGRAYKYGGSQ